MGKIVEMEGKTFGKLTVIERASAPEKGKRVSYTCKCECGKELVIDGKNLRNGSRTSCGCDKYAHMIGERFGKLVVLKQSLIKTTQNKIRFECLCECGNITITLGNSLRLGSTKSCGCVNSFNNMLIGKLLREWNIDHIPEKTFEDCKYIAVLPFDFYIPSLNMCIEYDGEYHYLESTRNSKKKLKLQQKRDKIKTDYCKQNNIELLRIPYWEKENIEEILEQKVKKSAKRLNERATFNRYLNSYLCNYLF